MMAARRVVLLLASRASPSPTLTSGVSPRSFTVNVAGTHRCSSDSRRSRRRGAWGFLFPLNIHPLAVSRNFDNTCGLLVARVSGCDLLRSEVQLTTAAIWISSQKFICHQLSPLYLQRHGKTRGLPSSPPPPNLARLDEQAASDRRAVLSLAIPSFASKRFAVR